MLFHVGLDVQGGRHRRMRGQAESRRHRERRQLMPVIVVAATSRPGPAPCQPRWRNAVQRRRFLLLTEQVRADRRCFLMTLRRPPLIHPVLPF